MGESRLVGRLPMCCLPSIKCRRHRFHETVKSKGSEGFSGAVSALRGLGANAYLVIRSKRLDSALSAACFSFLAKPHPAIARRSKRMLRQRVTVLLFKSWTP